MNIEGKVEDALVIVASDGGLETVNGVAVGLFQGHEFDEHALPWLGCYCLSAPEVWPQSGNYRARCKLVVRSTADKSAAETTSKDPVELHREIVGQLGTVFCVDQTGEGSLVDWRSSPDGPLTAGLLTLAVDEFTATMIGAVTWDKGNDGRHLWTSLEFDLWCCPKRLAG